MARLWVSRLSCLSTRGGGHSGAGWESDLCHSGWSSTRLWLGFSTKRRRKVGEREGQRTPESQNWNSVDCLKTLSFLFPQLQEIAILDNCQEIVLEMKKNYVELNILSKVLSFKAKGSPPDHDVNCTVHIAHTSHNCHNRWWCTFFITWCTFLHGEHDILAYFDQF